MSTWGQPAAASGWGAPQSAPATSTWGAAQAPTATTGWGAPARPAATGWGQPAAPAATGWGAPAAAPAAASGWGAPATAPATSGWGGTTAANAFTGGAPNMTQEIQRIVQEQAALRQMGQQLKVYKDAQAKRSQEIHSTMENIVKAMTNLQSKFEVDIVPKLPELKQKQLRLSHRVLSLMKKIELLRLSNGSNTSSVEEEVFRSKLQAIQRELQKPNLYLGRLKEISKVVKMQDTTTSTAKYDATSLDEPALEKLVVCLEEQKEGILCVSKIMKQDEQDLELIRSGL